jgi:hypothetical protein
VIGYVKIGAQQEAAAGANIPQGIGNREHLERFVRPGLESGLYARSRREHLERTAQSENLDFIKDINAYATTHGAAIY